MSYADASRLFGRRSKMIEYIPAETLAQNAKTLAQREVVEVIGVSVPYSTV